MPDFRAYLSSKIIERADGLCPYLTRLGGGALPGDIATAGDFIHCDSKRQPASLNLLYEVDDFGRIVLKTLPLPDTSLQYNLSLELARAKLAQIDEIRKHWAADGFEPSRTVREEIDRATDVFDRAEKREAASPPRAAATAECSLTRLLWAGEGLAVEAGWHGIRKKAADKSAAKITLGANLFGFGADDDYNIHFARLFNLAILPFHWRQFEPEDGAEQWHQIESMLDWTQANRIQAKGHPLVTLDKSDLPDWALQGSFDEIKQAAADRVARILHRCAGTIDLWDLIATADAGRLDFTKKQILELTAAVAEAARQAQPRARTTINIAAPFGEHAAQRPQAWGPLEYLSACIETGIDFDIIGLEFYFGSGTALCRDLLEISARLDDYAALGKPVHITAIGCPSSHKPDPFHLLGSGCVEDAGRWHGRWSEKLQAEWVEKFYVICCGKPYVESVMWWDVADCERHYFTHGGLLRHDLSPKPAYLRIERIAGELRVGLG